MYCHTCPHHESILRGDHNSNPWTDLPCASCKLGEDTFFSVPLDEENPPVPVAGYPQVPSAGGVPEGRGGSVDFLPAEVLSQFVQGFLNLDPELRDIVAWRYQGVSYREIAKRQSTSIQLAEMRHKRALREWPVLGSLFAEKVAKRKRRLARIGWEHGDCAPCSFHTTGHAVFRIRRLNPAEVTCASPRSPMV